MTKPNIVWIHTDSHDGRIMGCMGHPAMKRATPNMDRLAAMGALFRNFYTNNPICCPSRSSMLSGRYTYQCEAWNNYKGLRDDEPNLYTHFDEQGYRSAIYGKTDYLCGQHTIRARVDAWTRSAGVMRPAYNMPRPRVIESDQQRIQPTDWGNVDRAVSYLQNEATASEQPFLLYVGINQPHPEFTTSRRYMDMIDAAAVDLPELDNDQDHPVMVFQRLRRNWHHGMYPEMIKLVRHIYFAMIAEVDAMVGEIMAAMDEQGLWDNTYFVFSSDHGEIAMEHNLWYKMSMYEGSARVPFIAAGPGIIPGTQTDALASLIDVYPTFMDMTGLPTPDDLMGHSLLPEMRGEANARPDWVLSEFHDVTALTGITMWRTGDCKYVAYPGYAPQLFNMVDDPNELHNLAAERPDMVAILDAQLSEIVDYEAVDAIVKAHDKRCFRRWRQEQLSAGTYWQQMSRVHSGWDNLDPETIVPWSQENEQQIIEWMNS